MDLFGSLLLLLPLISVSAEMEEFVARAGDEVRLSCPVKTSECGEYHSLKWYRDTTRVFVYSPIAGFKNGEDILMNRCLDPAQIALGAACPRGELEEGKENVELIISPIQMEDGGLYKCEITYLSVDSNCPIVHQSNLRTVAPPDFQHISVSTGGEDMAGQVVGPYAAGSTATFSCQSGGGKPAPVISWRFGDNEVEGEVEEEVDEEEWTITSTISIQLERQHSGATLTCVASHEALDEDMEADMQVDVNIAVEAVEIEEAEGKEGEEMEAVCRAMRSRPAATITWVLPDHVEYTVEEEAELTEDETYDTVSRVTFTPTSEDHGMSITCKAINEVMEEALEAEQTVNVLFAPRVSVSQQGQTVLAGEEAIINCLVEANPENLTSIEWYKDDTLVEEERMKFEGSWGTTLVISEVEPEDAGSYSCRAVNEVGEASSESSHLLEVHYPPSTKLSLSPEEPLAEEDSLEVKLLCSLEDGVPAVFTFVSWYFDDELLKVLPDPELCEEGYSVPEPSETSWASLNETDELEDPCRTEPTVLVLEGVTRHQMGLYSCAGSNSAGEGDPSANVFLDVLYPPGPSSLLLEDDVMKGADVVVICDLEEAGNPEATEFLWMKDGEEMEEKSANLSLASVGLGDEGNYSCAATNHVGTGEKGHLTLEVSAPPLMLVNLEEETSVVVGSEGSLQCQVECSPLCSIVWMVEEQEVDGEGEQYAVEEEQVEEDQDKDQFTSVVSTLSWTQEERTEEDFNITCRVREGEDLAEEVASITVVSVQYQTGLAEVVAEGEMVKGGDALLACLLEDQGKPEATHFLWTKDGEELEEKSSTLNVTSLSVSSTGNYSCAGVNPLGHGDSASLLLEVSAPPQLLQPLEEETTLVVDTSTSLQCWVECLPTCTVLWVVDGQPVEGEQFMLEEEQVEEDSENNQFPSVRSTLSWTQLDKEDDNQTVVCRVSGEDMLNEVDEMEELEEGFLQEEEQGVFESIESSTTIFVEYAPTSAQINSGPLMVEEDGEELVGLEVEEGEEVDSHFCSSEGRPSPSVSWLRDGEEVGSGGELAFPGTVTRKEAGEYTCVVGNKHGTAEAALSLSVLFRPSCEVTHLLEGGRSTLTCTSEANPQDVMFSWSLGEEEMVGEDEGLVSILALKTTNVSTGLYYCHVNNSMGADSCHLDLTEAMLTAGLGEHEIRIIIIVCIVVGVLLILLLACYYCHRRANQSNKAPTAEKKGKKATKDLENGNGKEQPSADKSFYENLPFHGLKSPPKQVLNPKTDDHLDYADADFKEPYVKGNKAEATAEERQRAAAKIVSNLMK